MAEESRKRRIRGGHRASTRRLMSSANDNIVTRSLDEESENSRKMKLMQQKMSLQSKLDLLKELDSDILNTIEEDKLDTEIEEADTFAEEIQGLIINIDLQLTEKVQASQGQSTQAQSSRNHTTVKLPKLDLKKFNGDIVTWPTFWDTYESSIHTNSSLSSIDKFNYLKSLLVNVAADAVSGLTLTSANYDDAVTILKSRFGNKQNIINKHMDSLLNLEDVTWNNNIKSLRQLHNSIETHIRGLRALGVSSHTYGGLLSSILMKKLPRDMKLLICRGNKEETWDIDILMDMVAKEIQARERAAWDMSTKSEDQKTSYASRRYNDQRTATALFSNNARQTCTYCKLQHSTNSCRTVTDINARKDILKREGRCFNCLRKNHIVQNCTIKQSCMKCGGRHHTSICSDHKKQRSEPREETSWNQKRRPENTTRRPDEIKPLSMYIDSRTPILLQTAKTEVFNLRSKPTIKARIILDSGSQRTYITKRLKDKLRLPTIKEETMTIKTFGSTNEKTITCEEVTFGLKTSDGNQIEMTAFSVPMICEPLMNQHVLLARENYKHLDGLMLADDANGYEGSDVDILIGSDQYWDIVTGRVKKGKMGPTAMHTRLGCVLSGPIEDINVDTVSSVNLASTHVLKCASSPVEMHEDSLDATLKKFWALESLGIDDNERSFYNEFEDSISIKNGRYEVGLPWKETHQILPDNYESSLRRLKNNIKRLGQDEVIRQEYDAVIRDQLKRGIIEVVKPQDTGEVGKVHYLPHRAVLRCDRKTTKLRIVYDASAKTVGPSLNDCLYTGPALSQHILDILIRFRNNRVALASDIEKAFLMIAIRPEDRNVLRFLWVDDVRSENPEIVVMRFCKVVFGVSSSPFLLNATIKHHIELYEETDPEFVRKFLNSIYVDDVTSGAQTDGDAYDLYIKSKTRLAEGGFNLRKFVTNSDRLRERIMINEEYEDSPQTLSDDFKRNKMKQGEDVESNSITQFKEEDQSYTKTVLGNTRSQPRAKQQKILGVLWNFAEDNLMYDLIEVCQAAKKIEPTKRHVVSIASSFYDPLGYLSPIIVQFKMLFKELCSQKYEWDEPIRDDMKNKWIKLLEDLEESPIMMMPRCYFNTIQENVVSCRLHGFCDASNKAYGAVIYLQVKTSIGNYTRFLVSKTRVSPMEKQTIPRLELLGALVLSRLMVTVKNALKSEITIDDEISWTDSKVSLFWIKGMDKEWKQFVQNRVNEVRKLLPVECWRHCPGSENPADILSRGMKPVDLSESKMWLNGPEWLPDFEYKKITAGLPCESDEEDIPNDCIAELKAAKQKKQTESSALMVQSELRHIGRIIRIEDFSDKQRLMRVTAYVMKFINKLKSKKEKKETGYDNIEITATELSEAEVTWIKHEQLKLKNDVNFKMWRKQFDLFDDKEGVIRCRGRLSNAEIPQSTKYPILLDKNSLLTELIVRECHKQVMHNGVKDTLTELRSKYWIVKGRQFVKKLLHTCVICRKMEGQPYNAPTAPPLPKFRVTEQHPFSVIGVDFAGPLYLKNSEDDQQNKVWICLYTCAITRAVHLDVVPNLTTDAFLRCFRRFTARRGIPHMIVSDNGATFKKAAIHITKMLSQSMTQRYLSNKGIKWSFNLEKAPWWGGFFERLVKSMKRCLRKTIGKAKLTYEELLTVVNETEMVLNSRPLTYVSSEDFEEPLTPSHLIYGRRLNGMPDIGDTDLLRSGEEVTSSDITKRMVHLQNVINHFWKRWKQEYLLELRDSHRYNKRKSDGNVIKVDDVVIVREENRPRGFWRLGKIKELITGEDGKTRGAVVRLGTSGRRSTTLKRPIQHLYPLEIKTSCVTEENAVDDRDDAAPETPKMPDIVRPKRTAAKNADLKRRIMMKHIA